MVSAALTTARYSGAAPNWAEIPTADCLNFSPLKRSILVGCDSDTIRYRIDLCRFSYMPACRPPHPRVVIPSDITFNIRTL